MVGSKIRMDKDKRQLYHSKREAITSKIIECGQNVKKLYMFVKELTGTSAVNPMPDEERYQKLSEEFANFFLSNIHKIRESLD